MSLNRRIGLFAALVTGLALLAGTGGAAPPPTAADQADAAPLPVAEPESVGMSSERLQRLSDAMAGYIDRKQVAGTVTLVARRGKVVHFEAQGERWPEEGAPMTRDTIFRIASMTKPIASVALMTLYEEGRFQLRDPIAKYLPEFTEMQVAVPPDADEYLGAPYKLVQAARSHHGSAHPDPHGRLREQLPRPAQGGLHGAADEPRSRVDCRRLRERPGGTPARVPSRRRLAVRALRGRRRPAGRSALRPNLRRVPEGTNLRAARYDGHLLLPARVEGRPLRRPLPSRRGRQDRPDRGAGPLRPARP